MSGKRYQEAYAKIDRDKEYPPGEAFKVLKSLPDAKFDETVEVAFRLGIDTRKADQMVRGTVSLPNGTGRSVRVGVFAVGDKAREATEAIMSGVATAASKSMVPFRTSSTSSSPPTTSAPASWASLALSPAANTATRTDRPVP